MITIHTLAGTWADKWTGYPADVARYLTEWNGVWAELQGLPESEFHWNPVNYIASFGPVPPGSPDKPSYKQSVQMGVDQCVADIQAIPGKHILVGYSQGAEVTGRVCLELIEGRLQDRLEDCLLCIGIGDPTRQKHDETRGTGKGWGISGLEIPKSSIRRISYATKGDIYCTTPDGETGQTMRAMYAALTELQIHNPTELVGDMIKALSGDDKLLDQLAELMTTPITSGIGIFDALIRLGEFASTSAHFRYHEWAVADAIDIIAAL
ncbi:alpha/beta hydrolase family protein [Mycolicibacterium austroafricanum]|uniref:PE-PPE domain-containing protein n=1 Tax=Mycolicibacterium austroafricanum TaxID=39687 RepID=UPI001ABFFFF9|nr:PE-PPE domain-containing protein [Mycolicibacterium austroafricanum]QRZ05875.1 PE-PPE domain-containing protein [Mycolicibacterium austroafricanum]